MKNWKRFSLTCCFLATAVCLCLSIALSQDEGQQPLPEDEYIDEVIRLTNVEREKVGAAPLAKSDDLEPPAMLRAEEQETKFSHTRPDGSKWSTAFDEFNIGPGLRGENLAKGQKTPEAVVKAWMNSKDHRKNMLDKRFTEIGVGHVVGSDGRHYWSQLFLAAVTDEAPEAPAATLPTDLPIAQVEGVNLNLRSEPSTKSSVVQILTNGTQMSVLEIDGDWARVRLVDGTEGWASTKYLKML